MGHYMEYPLPLLFLQAYRQDVTTVNGFTISSEVSLFFQPKREFSFARLLRSLTEKTLNASQIYFGFLFLKVFKCVIEFEKLAFHISLPLLALLELPLPALSSPASRTPPTPYSPGLPLTCHPPVTTPPPRNGPTNQTGNPTRLRKSCNLFQYIIIIFL